jgi:uncharacterized protein (TIGR00725 family)
MLRKLPIVGVFGQGTPLAPERAALARAVGAMVARLGAHLLTGGGYGAMETVAEGFVVTTQRQGLSIGIVPREPGGRFDEPNHDRDGRPYPNRFVEVAIMTPLPPRADDWQTTPARNHINVLTPHAIVALPGGVGTRNELDMAAHYCGERDQPREQRHTILLGPENEFSPQHRKLFVHVETVDLAEPLLRRMLATERRAREPVEVS